MSPGQMLLGQMSSWQLKMFNVVLGTYPLNLVKIGPVTAEIFLICTNDARTNAAWTNVIMAVEICSIKFYEPTL